MSEEGFKADWRCPACGRENQATASLCSLCLAPRWGATQVTAEPRPASPFAATADEDYPNKRSMSDFWRRLPGVTTAWLVGACVLLFLFFGVGVALIVVLAPALHYLSRVDRERSPSPFLPPPGRAGQTIAAGLAGIAIAGLVIVSSVIAFVAVCAPTGTYALIGLEPVGAPVQVVVWVAGLAVGLAAAAGVGYGIVRLFFRREKREDGPWETPGEDLRP